MKLMKHHHGVHVKFGQHGLPRPLVNDVNVSLKGDAHQWSALPLQAQHSGIRQGTRPSPAIHLLVTLKHSLPFMSLSVPPPDTRRSAEGGGKLCYQGPFLTRRTVPREIQDLRVYRLPSLHLTVIQVGSDRPAPRPGQVGEKQSGPAL